ncbi:MAG: nucleoside-diphosphate-sugar epimerase, partial [Pirellulaceae bacterium]
MSKLVVGCGYLGHRVARLWKDKGHHVHVVTRNADRAKNLEKEGFDPLVVDITNPNNVTWPNAETVLFAVGFDHRKYQSIDDVFVDGLKNVVSALPSPQRFIYISSTGVYGQTDGDWVDEDSPCDPARPGGKACLAAEQILGEIDWKQAVTVLRLAGIYGPDRVPRQADIRNGFPIPGSSGYLNLIHVDDAASIVVTVGEHPSPANHYVVSDGQPVLRNDYYSELARLLEAPEP